MPMAREDEEADPEQDGVRELLQAMEVKMRKLSDQRRTHNESARTNADKRDAIQKQYGSLRNEIKEILESQKEVRVKAKIHQARRDARKLSALRRDCRDRADSGSHLWTTNGDG